MIGVALFLFVVEFVADKIQLVDSVWDVIHTFIRIPAGAVLAATAFGDFDRRIQVIALLVGGGLALSSHGAKAATRAVINASPEPVSNIVVSLAEDVLVIVSVLLAVFLPNPRLFCDCRRPRFFNLDPAEGNQILPKCRT